MTAPEAALTDYLRRECRAQSVEILEFSRLTGGAIQDNHALTVRMAGGTHPGEHRFVLRSDAPSRIAASLDRSQEFHVLKVAHEAGLTVPQPLWLCTDPAVLGRNFFIMQRAEGTSAPRTFLQGALDPGQTRALTRRLGEELALLHRVRPPHPDLKFLELPAGPPSLHRVRTYQHALQQIDDPHPVLDWALTWLADHAPTAHSPVLCHCDFRTGNYMVRDGQLSAVLDWEFAAWSDPYEDLGWLCCRSWRFGVREREVGGLGDKADLFAGYSAASGRPVDACAVEYWEIMGLVRWSVIALQQAQRHLSGEEPSLELALTGRMLPEMEFDLLDQIGHLTHDPQHRQPEAAS
ncbi:MAG: phosphotransferase family protein [Castellaniella sp.]|uniref:phosphotransferase family protein n=1 Tax=Castellaniella sp. TaxID=1955812 RepID=UPI001227FF8F|nr:phosphotransferase family protein [Castellaniella sp.]TAN28489.1 MAG: phosphotransferase family protein [Castellaniella sp.]